MPVCISCIVCCAVYRRSLNAYLGDISFFDRLLMKMHDDLLPKLDSALRE